MSLATVLAVLGIVSFFAVIFYGIEKVSEA